MSTGPRISRRRRPRHVLLGLAIEDTVFTCTEVGDGAIVLDTVRPG